MIKKNVKKVVLLAIIALFSISTQTFSQNYCNYDNWNMNSGMRWWNNGIPNEYALSADQITIINEIRANSNEKIMPLQNELFSLRTEFRKYNSGSDTDIKEIKSQRSKIRNVEDKIADINLEAQVQIKKNLGKEQLNYFNNDGYGWWNMADNCWHSNQNMMTSGTSGRMMSNRGNCGW